MDHPKLVLAIIRIPIRANQKLQNMSDESVKQEQPCIEEDYFLDKYKKHYVSSLMLLQTNLHMMNI